MGQPNSQGTDTPNTPEKATENKPTPFKPQGSRGDLLEQTDIEVNEDGKGRDEPRAAGVCTDW